MSDQKKVLVVDDNRELCNVLSDSLSGDQIEVEQAYDGEEGLKKALDQHPDLILLDILMPNMDGWEMLEKLREDKWGKEADVIMLTNLSDIENISKAVDRGTFEYLIKTEMDIEDVAKKVREKLGL